MTAFTDLLVVVTEQGSEVDSGLPFPELGVVVLLEGIGVIVDALVAAEQAEGDLASLTSAMGTFTTELRAQATAAAEACATCTRTPA